MAFNTPFDVANRALQHLGQRRITNFTDISLEATETSFVHDKARRFELRRAVWTFATKRMVLRSTATNGQVLSFGTYAAATAYTAGDVVWYNGMLWLNIVAATGVTPGIESYNPKWIPYFGQRAAMTHDVTVAYLRGDVVTKTAVVYLCVAPHTNQVPPNTTYWHVMQGAGAAAEFLYAPEGYEKDGSTVRKKFYLPANYMRLAAQDPKRPSTSSLATSGGQRWNDWEIEGNAVYSTDLATGSVVRFVADTTDVTGMDDMFCEAWAARIAMSLCERFTQSKDKMEEIQGLYEQAIGAARAMSSIEAGSTEADYEQRAAPPQQPGQ